MNMVTERKGENKNIFS